MSAKLTQICEKYKIPLLCLLPFAAFGLLLAAACAYRQWMMPHMHGCFLRTLTGLHCPGCGMTHAVFALCRGDLPEALRENAVIPAAVLIAVLRYAELWASALGRKRKLLPRKAWFWWGLLGLWLLYALLRNPLGI